MSNAIYRYEVPVDDEWHEIRCSPVLHVACRSTNVVEFWAHALDDAPARKFRVYGTGHPVDPHVMYAGTAIASGGSLVWHLMAKW